MTIASSDIHPLDVDVELRDLLGELVRLHAAPLPRYVTQLVAVQRDTDSAAAGLADLEQDLVTVGSDASVDLLGRARTLLGLQQARLQQARHSDVMRAAARRLLLPRGRLGDTLDETLLLAALVLDPFAVPVEVMVLIDQHTVCDPADGVIVTAAAWVLDLAADLAADHIEVVGHADAYPDEEIRTAAALWSPFEDGGVYHTFRDALAAARRLL